MIAKDNAMYFGHTRHENLVNGRLTITSCFFGCFFWPLVSRRAITGQLYQHSQFIIHGVRIDSILTLCSSLTNANSNKRRCGFHFPTYFCAPRSPRQGAHEDSFTAALLDLHAILTTLFPPEERGTTPSATNLTCLSLRQALSPFLSSPSSSLSLPSTCCSSSSSTPSARFSRLAPSLPLPLLPSALSW